MLIILTCTSDEVNVLVQVELTEEEVLVQAQPLHLVYDMVVNVIQLLVLHVVALTHLVRKIVVVVFVLFETEEEKLMNLFTKKLFKTSKFVIYYTYQKGMVAFVSIV